MAFQSRDQSLSAEPAAPEQVVAAAAADRCLQPPPLGRSSGYERLRKSFAETATETRFNSLQGIRRWRVFALAHMLARAGSFQKYYEAETISKALVPDLLALCDLHSRGQRSIIVLLNEHASKLTISVPRAVVRELRLSAFRASASPADTCYSRIDHLLGMHSLHTLELQELLDNGRYFSDQSTCKFIVENILRNNEQQGWLLAQAILQYAHCMSN